MKNKRSILIILISSFILIMLSNLPMVCAEELTISINDWSPYIDQELPNQGFLSEIVIKSFEQMGIKVKLSYKP